jgi:hypothetical protein
VQQSWFWSCAGTQPHENNPALLLREAAACALQEQGWKSGFPAPQPQLLDDILIAASRRWTEEGGSPAHALLLEAGDCAAPDIALALQQAIRQKQQNEP